MDCYRLARFYRQSPDLFLDMSVTQIAGHMYFTNLLLQEMDRDGDDD